MSLPPSYNLLAKHLNPWYVETGIWKGDSLDLAKQAKFKRIIGVEQDQECIDYCKQRFGLHNGYIKIIKGDSAVCLWDVIKNISEPITFLLDAHTQFFEDEQPTENPLPLLEELKQIARHPVKKHTILIDDILILTHPETTGWTRQTIEEHIYAINPNYRIEYIANPVRENFLIATI